MLIPRILRRATRVAASVLALIVVTGSVAAADDSDAAWAALAKGGHVALVRHANAPPGFGGDPPGMRINDCTTQRNLDDTARLMDVGPVDTSWALLPDQDRRSPVRLSELKTMIAAWRGPGTLVLVTHGFTVQNLLGIVPGQAETLVLKPVPGDVRGGELVGRIPVPE